MALDTQTVGMAFAVLGVAFSFVWMLLGVKGIRSLQDIGDAIRERESAE